MRQEIIHLPANHIGRMSGEPARTVTPEMLKSYARKTLQANWVIRPVGGQSQADVIERIAAEYARWMAYEPWSFVQTGIGDPTLIEVAANICPTCYEKPQLPGVTPPITTAAITPVPGDGGWLVPLAIGGSLLMLYFIKEQKEGRRR